MTIDDNEQQCVHKHNKSVQEVKRQMLNVELERYELQLQHHEQLYENELAIFQSEIYKSKSSYQICHFNELMHLIKTYVTQHTKLLLRQIRYKESAFHIRLLRHYRRRSSLISNKTIDVYPQIIIDVPKVSLNHRQLDYLSHG